MRTLALLLLAAVAACSDGPAVPTLADADTLSAVVTDTVLPQGRYQVVVPPLYELANVALSRTDFAKSSTFLIEKRGSYHQEVAAWFGPHDAHPLIGAIEPPSGGWIDAYYGLRDNALRYGLTGDAEIGARGGYGVLWTPDLLARHHGALEAYAAATRFADFFEAHRARYRELVEAYRRTVPLGGMWAWLERSFPARYQLYTVVLSPLVNGSHSTHAVTHASGAREILMLVPTADVVRDVASPALRGYLLDRIVFTEIDHNYVDPISDAQRAGVDRAFADWRAWNTGSRDGYASAYRTFNEYMTWAVFSLYMMDAYDAAQRDEALVDLERFMTQGRGFPRFAAFNRELMRLYAARQPGERVADLYPRILAWAEAFRG